MDVEIRNTCSSLFESSGDWALAKPFISASLCSTLECYRVDCRLACQVSLEKIGKCLLDLGQALQSQEWKEDYTVSANLKEEEPVASHLFLRVYRRAEANVSVSYVPHFGDPNMEREWYRALRETNYPPLQERFKTQRVAYSYTKAKTLFQNFKNSLVKDRENGALRHFVFSPQYEARIAARVDPSFIEMKNVATIFLGSALAVVLFLTKTGGY